MRYIKNYLFSSLLLLLFSSSSTADDIDFECTFRSGLSVLDDTGEIFLGNSNSFIYQGDGNYNIQVNPDNLTGADGQCYDEGGTVGTDGENCEGTGTYSVDIELPTFPDMPTDTGTQWIQNTPYEVTDNSKNDVRIEIGAGNTAEIKNSVMSELYYLEVRNQSNVKLVADTSNAFVIKTLFVGGGDLIVEPGTYYIETFTLQAGGDIIVQGTGDGSGTARLLVKNTVQLNGGTDYFNYDSGENGYSQDPSKLFIASYTGDVNIQASGGFAGYAYAPNGDAFVGAGGTGFAGAITANNIELQAGVEFYYLDNALIDDTCTPTVPAYDDEPVCGIFPSVLTSYEHLALNKNNVLQSCYISYPDGEFSNTHASQTPTCYVDSAQTELCLDEDGNSDNGNCNYTPPPDYRYDHNFVQTGDFTTTTNSNGSVILTEYEYGSIEFSANNQNIAFSPTTYYADGSTRKIMVLGDITLSGNNQVLTFQAGDYYFRSLSFLKNGPTIQTVGDVRFFIQNDFIYGGNGATVTDPNSSLFVYVGGDVSISSTGGGNGWLGMFMYVKGDVEVKSNSNTTFYGGITAEGRIDVTGNNFQFEYNVEGAEALGMGECACPTVGFELANYQISEDIFYIGTESFVETHIILSRALNYDVQVSYSTEDGTATFAEGDYRRKINQIVTIPAGETDITLPIGIFNDAPIELTEFFFVNLHDPSPSDDICLDINRTQIDIVAQSDSPVCFEDEFDNGLDSKWKVLRSRGGFTPDIYDVNGDKRLRLTSTANNLATTITKDYEFDTSENLIIVEFDYYAYGGCGNNGGIGTYGADGIVNTLFDSGVGSEPRPGGSGGSMGYAQYVGNTPGFEGGWLGLGIDEYGNFSNPTESRIGGTGFKRNAIAIRGDGEGMLGYEFLEGAENINPPVAAKRSDGLSDYYSGRYKFTVDARDPAHLYLRLERDIGGGYSSIISQFDAKNPQYNQGETPEKVRYAISSGTGGGCNNHELGWIRLKGNCAVYGTPPETGPFDAWDTFRHTTPLAPSDKNISTKIVEKPFELSLVSLNADFSAYETKTGTGLVDVALYPYNSKTAISDTIIFDATSESVITGEFNVPRAYQEVVVGFKMCATNEINATTSEYVYRLWPSANCTQGGAIYDCTAATSDGVPTWHLCYSSDSFAIRPESFDMTIPTNPIVAGEPYTIDYNALDASGQPTLGYSQARGGSFDFTTDLEPAMAGCLNQNIDIGGSIDFSNGTYSGDTLFNTIGDFNLTLHEVEGSEFAKVDADDTPYGSSEERFITPYVLNGSDTLHIVPSGFTLNTTFTDANPVTNRTYMHDITGTNKTMASTLNIRAQAIIADGSPAENYESDCYADVTDLLVDFNYTQITPDGITQLQYEKVDAPTQNGTSTITTQSGTDMNNQNFTIEDFPSTLFEDGDEGEATISLALNVDRVQNQPVNPFVLRINDVNLTEDDTEVSAEQTVNSVTNYYYARTRSSRSLYPNITSSSVGTPIAIDIYCDLGFIACDALGIDTIFGQTNESEWWINTSHSMAQEDGNITLVNDTGTLTPTTVNVGADGVDRTVTVGSGGVAPLEVNVDLVTTNPSDTSEWLIYNSESAINPPSPLYRVRFIDVDDGWAGVGETGHVLSKDANSKKPSRVSW